MPQVCLKYYGRLDPDGYLQAGTMQGFNPRISLPCGQECEWALLTVEQMVIPSGCTACVHPTGLRFFYGVNRKTNKIVPNSLIISREFPQPNSCEWREWYKVCCP